MNIVEKLLSKIKKIVHMKRYLINFFKLFRYIMNCNILCFFVVKLIKCYRYLFSPMLPSNCRFYPSCSTYALETFQIHGFWKAVYLSFWRILKCNPFNQGGVDLVDQITHYKSKNCDKHF